MKPTSHFNHFYQLRLVILACVLFTPLKTQAVEIYRVLEELPRAEISAFTSSIDETDDAPDITASGKKTTRQTLACPSRYKFGTLVEIKGAIFVCEDRMNKRYRAGNYFDVWKETKAEALKWGRQKITVRIIVKNPPKPEMSLLAFFNLEMSYPHQSVLIPKVIHSKH